MNAEQATKLRAEFAPESIGKLPRITCKACSDKKCQEHQKRRCETCGNFISTQHIHLDFVGHAAVTDRLLRVDPSWTWEPLGHDERGLPALDAKGGLWITLEVCGVTRLGYGHGGTGFEPGDDVKKAIGDALRNAAMRFGVALDLWAKEDLKAEASGEPLDRPVPSPAGQTTPAGAPSSASASPESSADEAHNGAARTGTPSETVQESGNPVTSGSGNVSPETPAPGAVIELGASGAKKLADALGGQKFALDLARDQYGSDVTSLRKLTFAQGAELLEIAGKKVPA